MRTRVALALAIAALSLLGTGATAQAALTVANTNDSGAGSLRQAILEAPPGETINVPAGTYTLTSEALKIEKGLTISGADAASTIVRSAGNFAVVQAVGKFALNISNLTIRDANRVLPSGVILGAGITSSGPNLTLTGVVITNNRADTSGVAGGNGGVVLGAGLYQSEGSLNLVNTTISDNTANANGGSGKNGGIAQGAGVSAIGTLTMSNSTIANNVATAIGGQGAASPEQNGGIAQGGGAFLIIPGKPNTASIAGSTMSGNRADVSGGPGASSGIIQGGGVFLITETPTTITSSTIVTNSARAATAGGIVQGGGLFAITGEKVSTGLLSTTLADNRIESSAALSEGGNVFPVGPMSLRNSIVANGVGPAGNENCAGEPEGLFSLGFNLDSLDQCGFKAPGDLVNTNPQLGPLQLNGGSTQTMVPAPGSPLIDAGQSFALAADQRGAIRPLDLPSVPNSPAGGADGSDIGAVEFVPSNAFTLGKFLRNKKKGTATLSIALPSPSAGTLTLSGKGLKTQTATIAGETEVKLKVAAASKKIKKALRKRGKRKVGINVTYAPTGNSAATQSRKAKLVKKRKKKRRKPAKR